MKVVQFDASVRQKLKANGFTHIEIRNTITDEGFSNPSERMIKTFKALDRIDTMPVTSYYVPIDSSEIDRYLSDNTFNCYIVVPKNHQNLP